MEDRNKNLDIINLLQNLRESVNLQEDDAGDIDYSSLSIKELEDKLKGLQIKLNLFTSDSSSKRQIKKYIDSLEKELQKREASVGVDEAAKVPQTMQPKDKLEDNPELVGMKDGEVSDKSKEREDVIKEIPDKDLEKFPTQENKLWLCNECCRVFRA